MNSTILCFLRSSGKLNEFRKVFDKHNRITWTVKYNEHNYEAELIHFPRDRCRMPLIVKLIQLYNLFLKCL